MSDFVRNRHSHIVFDVKGCGLTGQQEVERLRGAGYTVERDAEECLIEKIQTGFWASECPQGYQEGRNKLLTRQYKIALVKADRVSVIDSFIAVHGYAKAPTEVVLRLREIVSDNQMREMGTWGITTLDPMYTFDRSSYYKYYLYAACGGRGNRIKADLDIPWSLGSLDPRVTLAFISS